MQLKLVNSTWISQGPRAKQIPTDSIFSPNYESDSDESSLGDVPEDSDDDENSD